MSATVLLGGQVDKIPGGHDDRTTDGIVRTKLDQGDMVVWLPRQQQYSNISGNGTAGIVQAALPEATDRGVGGRISLTTANFSASIAGQGDAGIGLPLWGRRIGVVLMNSSATSAAVQVDCFVDGRCVRQADPVSRFGRWDLTGGVNQGPPATGMNFITLADDLPDDGPHMVEVWVRTPTSGFSHVQVLGFLVERRMGYRDTAPVDTLGAPQSATANDLSTTNAQVPYTSYYSSASASSYLRGVRRLDYYNSDSVAHNVLLTVTLNSLTFLRTVSVPAAATVGGTAVPGFASFDFGQRVAVDSSWQHKLAEVIVTGGTKVTCIPIGGV